MDDQTKNLIKNHIDNNEVCLFMKGTPDAPQCGFSMAVSNILKILEGDCETAVGIYSKIDANKITVEAELFSLDGSQRFYEKKSDKLENFRELGNEIGQILKTKSNNSYKR